MVFVRPGGGYHLAEDDENKALLIDRALIFAYTGLARIEGDEGAYWLARVLKPFVDRGEIGPGTLEVARRASVFFAGRYPDQLHTFIGAGWQQRRRDGLVFPVAVRITNADDDSFRPLPRPRADFTVQVAHLRRPNGLELYSDGVPMDRATLLRCQRMLRRSYYLNSPLNSARLLVREFRSFAGTLGPQGPVGNNLMVTCLPLEATRTYSPVHLGPPDGKSASTFYVPGTVTEWTCRSPILIQRGFPIYLSDVGFQLVPAPELDPYPEWR